MKTKKRCVLQSLNELYLVEISIIAEVMKNGFKITKDDRFVGGDGMYGKCGLYITSLQNDVEINALSGT